MYKIRRLNTPFSLVSSSEICFQLLYYCNCQDNSFLIFMWVNITIGIWGYSYKITSKVNAAWKLLKLFLVPFKGAVDLHDYQPCSEPQGMGKWIPQKYFWGGRNSYPLSPSSAFLAAIKNSLYFRYVASTTWPSSTDYHNISVI